MNNDCGNIHTTPLGNTYVCDLGRGHTGYHKRHTNSGFTLLRQWTNTNPSQTTKDCRSVYYEAKGGESGTYRCQLKDGHPGSHLKTFLTRDTVTWADKPIEEVLQESLELDAKGRKIINDHKPKMQHVYMNGMHIGTVGEPEPATFSDDEPEETPVLLTLEDLKVLAYYLSSDDNDDDAPTRAKIDEALKNML